MILSYFEVEGPTLCLLSEHCPSRIWVSVHADVVCVVADVAHLKDVPVLYWTRPRLLLPGESPATARTNTLINTNLHNHPLCTPRWVKMLCSEDWDHVLSGQQAALKGTTILRARLRARDKVAPGPPQPAIHPLACHPLRGTAQNWSTRPNTTPPQKRPDK